MYKCLLINQVNIMNFFINKKENFIICWSQEMVKRYDVPKPDTATVAKSFAQNIAEMSAC